MQAFAATVTTTRTPCSIWNEPPHERHLLVAWA
jgi:hypothetical protein